MTPIDLDVSAIGVGNTLPTHLMGKPVTKKSKRQFAEDLKAWRTRKKLSQSQAAVFIGSKHGFPLSVRTLQNWEIERTKPNAMLEAVIRKIIKR